MSSLESIVGKTSNTFDYLLVGRDSRCTLKSAFTATTSVEQNNCMVDEEGKEQEEQEEQEEEGKQMVKEDKGEKEEDGEKRRSTLFGDVFNLEIDYDDDCRADDCSEEIYDTTRPFYFKPCNNDENIAESKHSSLYSDFNNASMVDATNSSTNSSSMKQYTCSRSDQHAPGKRSSSRTSRNGTSGGGGYLLVSMAGKQTWPGSTQKKYSNKSFLYRRTSTFNDEQAATDNDAEHDLMIVGAAAALPFQWSPIRRREKTNCSNRRWEGC
jgi:hypothetical protein